MSKIYIERMRHVQQELEASRAALAYVTAKWDDFLAEWEGSTTQIKQIVNPLTPKIKRKFEETALNLDETYFIRLTAEFEGILKDHLRTNHPTIPFPAQMSDWKVDWFLSKVKANERSVKIDAQLRNDLDAIRDYRNVLAHGNQIVARVTFPQALSTYNKFLGQLPDPR